MGPAPPATQEGVPLRFPPQEYKMRGLVEIRSYKMRGLVEVRSYKWVGLSRVEQGWLKYALIR